MAGNQGSAVEKQALVIGAVVGAHLSLCLGEFECGAFLVDGLAATEHAANRVGRQRLGGAEGDNGVNLAERAGDVIEGTRGGRGNARPRRVGWENREVNVVARRLG
jgi:hypothetical protein